MTIPYTEPVRLCCWAPSLCRGWFFLVFLSVMWANPACRSQRLGVSELFFMVMWNRCRWHPWAIHPSAANNWCESSSTQANDVGIQMQKGPKPILTGRGSNPTLILNKKHKQPMSDCTKKVFEQNCLWPLNTDTTGTLHRTKIVLKGFPTFSLGVQTLQDLCITNAIQMACHGLWPRLNTKFVN